MIGQSFWRWISHGFRLLGLSLPLASIVQYVYAHQSDLRMPTEKDVKEGLLIQAIIISVGAAILFAVLSYGIGQEKKIPKRTIDGVEIAYRAARQFSKLFLGLLIGWCVLYFYWFRYPPPLPAIANHPYSAPDPIANFLNNACSCFIIACYYTLSHYSVPRATPGSLPPIAIIHRERHLVLTAIVLILIFSVIQGAFNSSSFMHWAVQSGEFEQGSRFISWVSGAIAGIATMLLAERLGSRDIAAPFVLILILYLYGTIQFAWPFFTIDLQLPTQDEALWLQFILPFIALVGKTTLFVVVLWIFDTGRLEFYMWRSRKSLDTVRSDWQTFESAFSTLPESSNAFTC